LGEDSQRRGAEVSQRTQREKEREREKEKMYLSSLFFFLSALSA